MMMMMMMMMMKKAHDTGLYVPIYKVYILGILGVYGIKLNFNCHR